MEIRAAVTKEKGSLAIEKVQLAEPKATEVLVKIVASSICHTDAAGIHGFVPWIKYPMVFGHEGVGIVEQVGSTVESLKPGDRVALTCGKTG